MASNIVLADAQATPVNHTFVPMGRDNNGVFVFEDQSATNAIGNGRITVELKKPTAAQAKMSSEGRTVRARVTVSVPVLETVSNATVSGIPPAPTVSYIPRATMEFIMPERSTLQNRKDLRKFVASVLGDTQILGVVENLVYLS